MPASEVVKHIASLLVSMVLLEVYITFLLQEGQIHSYLFCGSLKLWNLYDDMDWSSGPDWMIHFIIRISNLNNVFIVHEDVQGPPPSTNTRGK